MLVLVLVLGAQGLVAARPPVAAATDPAPNILVFVTDDQRPDTMDVMPRTLSWFADGGTTYTHGYVTTPLCCPSRSTIFTGRYAHNHGVHTNSAPADALALDQSTTFTATLHDAGYQTGMVGKYLNSWPASVAPPYFDHFEMQTNYNYYKPTMNIDGTVGPVPGYATDLLGNGATEMLDGFETNDDQPWLLYVAPIAPHEPFTAATRDKDAAVSAWDGNPGVAEADRSDKPPFIRSKHATLSDGQAIRTKQLRTLMSVDEMVDEVMTELTELDEGNTLAIFLSDNGLMWAEHGVVSQKRLPYLQSIGVPFYARWPGHIPPGAVDDRLVANVDLKPTILEASGVASTSVTDGISLLQPTVRSRLPLEYYVSPDTPSFPSWAATLTPDSEYVEYYGADLQTITFREYYDLASDQWQNENLLGNASTTDDPDVAALSEALAVDRACSGAACVDPPVPDTNPPTSPPSLSADVVAGGVALTWGAAVDDAGVTNYAVERDGVGIATLGPVTTYTDRSASSSTSYTYTVRALDRAGNASGQSPPADVTTPAPAPWFTDGFESGSMTGWTFVKSVTPVEGGAATGAWSARAVANGGVAYASKTLPTNKNEVYIHARFRVDARGASIMALTRAIASGGASLVVVAIQKNGTLGYRVGSVAPWRTAPVVPAPSAWHDLVVHVNVGTGAVELWLDGTLTLSRSEALGTTSIAKFHIGDSASGRTFDVRYDDVSIGPAFPS